jgi:NADH-quinone oxidoreductase subunit D
MAVVTPKLNITEIPHLEISEFNDSRPVISVDPSNLVASVGTLYGMGLNHLSTIIGLQEDDHLTALYPLSGQVEDSNLNKTVFIKTQVPLDNPSIDTLVDIFPAIDVYERELTDLLGFQFNNITPREKLVLPDNFPEDLFPLRKGLTGKEIKEQLDELGLGNEKPEPLKTTKDFVIRDLEENADYSITVGPQHPTHKEPIRFQFFVKGEDIADVKVRIGFNHRGIEKALEMNTWIQNLYLIERICGICSAAHQLAYSVTAERLCKKDSEIPDRAEWLRVLVSELERIHSHMLWYGVLAHDAGYDMMFHVSWRDREMVMDLLERITGNRVNYSMMTLGGVRRDISRETSTNALKILKKLRKKVVEHKDVIEGEKTFVARLSDVGVLSKDDAIKFGAVGPTARSSGVNFDLRRDYPYSGYKDIPLKVYTRPEGDVYASLIVRMDETLESIDMCIYILENLPSGEIKITIPPRLPEGEAHTRIEAPRGEDIHYLRSTGGKGPDRHKVRAPTLANIVSLQYRFRSMQIADIPIIIRLIDPCIGCMERVTFVDVDSAKTKILSGQELIYRANKKHRLNQPIRLFRG